MFPLLALLTLCGTPSSYKLRRDKQVNGTRAVSTLLLAASVAVRSRSVAAQGVSTREACDAPTVLCRLTTLRTSALTAVSGTVRMSQSRVGRIEGRLVRVADSLVVERSTGLHAIALSDVDSLWIEHDHKGRNAMIGGVVGALVLSSLIRSFATIDGQPLRFGINRDPHWRAFLAGGAVGALSGASIGKDDRYWELTFP